MYSELVRYITENLVDNPDQVCVSEEEVDDVIVVTLKVAREDMGKVIGKQGKIAKAMRMVVRAAAGKTRKKVNVDIVE